MGYKGDTGNNMSEHEEYFVSDNVIKIMQPVKEYNTEKDFTSLKAWQKAKSILSKPSSWIQNML